MLIGAMGPKVLMYTFQSNYPYIGNIKFTRIMCKVVVIIPEQVRCNERAS